ncbi:MAG: DUF1579 domain-containing protein [Calditrichaeota bacterium]|nr:MAG: DUF1579 domain-containing protein [Calditrichota bacterium]
MKKVHVSIILLIGQFLWITPNLAQENQHQRPCDLPEGKQLDFWLGHWELSWPAEQFGGTPGTLQHGTNTVTKILDNCIIYESFRFPDGNFNGHSFSVYDARSHQWKQTWVDNKGSYLLFTGEFKDGKMILSTAPYTRNGKTFISRMVFRNITSDSFDWDWQRSSDNGKTWQDMWNIHYQRSE